MYSGVNRGMIQNSLTIGITGSIGTGKSTVSAYLVSKGYKVIDADQISRDIYYIGSEAYNELVSNFGKDILDTNNNIDRKTLKKIVFSDIKKLDVLNKIVHPIIENEIEEKKQYYLESSKLLFIDAALLIEAGLNKKVDKIMLVTCNEDVQIERIVARDNVSIDTAKNIISSQMPISDKIKYADFVIENNVSINLLHNKIDEILIQLEKGSINV